MYLLRRLFYYLTYPLRAMFSSPMALFLQPKRLLGMSLPMRVAVLVAVFLIVLTIALLLAAILPTMAADWLNLFASPLKVLLIIALLIVIPIIVYWAVKLWLEGEVSRFPDIDRDWNAGMAALAEQGIDLTETPLFLVLGVDDEQHAKSLFRASQVSLRVHDVPEGPGTLHWYANPDAVYLVCTGAGQLAKLHQFIARADVKGALAGDSGPRAEKPRVGRGTMIADSGDEDTVGPGTIPDEMRQQLSSMNVAGTMMVPDGFSSVALSAAVQGTPAKSVQLPMEEAGDGTQRLEYVCQLLRRVRQPVCPINGVLSLISFGLVKRGTEAAGQIQATTKNDLTTLSGRFQLRFPVVAMIGGMEIDDGFRELVRRVGPDEAKAHRFGKGFGVWNEPHPEQIEAVSAHACGAFEDWTYSLFRQRDGLNHPGNRKLYSLLCTIRSHLRKPLTDILTIAFGHDPVKDGPKSVPTGFAGCYFAATGNTEDRQAFVQSVFRKLVELEEDLEWSDAALVENERYQRLSSAATVICGIFVASWVGMLLLKYVILKT